MVFDLLVDVINSLLHASNHLNRASQAAVFKGKFCCLGRDDDLEANLKSDVSKIEKRAEIDKDNDLPLEGQM